MSRLPGTVILSLLLVTPAFTKQITFKSDISCNLPNSDPCVGEKKPVWTGDFASPQARAQIVKNATIEAYAKLAYCGRHIHIITLFDWQGGNEFHERVLEFRDGDWTPRSDGGSPLRNARGTVVLGPAYVPVSRGKDLAGRVSPSIVMIAAPYFLVRSHEGWMIPTCDGEDPGHAYGTYPGSKDSPYWDQTSIPVNDLTTLGVPGSPVPEGATAVCYREEIHAPIEVFPEIFIRKAYCIHDETPPGKPNGRGRWARDPIEAAMYVILHELGHLESFISQESNYHLNNFLWAEQRQRLPPIGNTEDDANAFASSVMHCDQGQILKRFH